MIITDEWHETKDDIRPPWQPTANSAVRGSVVNVVGYHGTGGNKGTPCHWMSHTLRKRLFSLK